MSRSINVCWAPDHALPLARGLSMSVPGRRHGPCSSRHSPALSVCCRPAAAGRSGGAVPHGGAAEPVCCRGVCGGGGGQAAEVGGCLAAGSLPKLGPP